MTKQVVKSKKILVVEDEKPMLEILTDRFTAEGFKVFGAKNEDEGLKLALKKHPDLILLDIVLSNMKMNGGIVLLKKLRTDNWGKNVPVIILTNLYNFEAITEALENGAYYFLIKSDWRLEEIVKRVKQRLGIKTYLL